VRVIKLKANEKLVGVERIEEPEAAPDLSDDTEES
jgi:hypothetical protein